MKPSHPAAELFPLLEGAEFEQLVNDIREHGQREPIIVHDGMILDGRNRWRACEQLGIEPAVERWDGTGTPEQFVISRNIMRRHLTSSQRAWLMSELTNLRHGQHPEKKNKKEDLANTRSPTMTVSEAAEMANVPEAHIYDAKAVRERGTSEQKDAVASGRIGVRKAADQIRGTAKKPKPRKKNAKLADTGKNPERIQRQREKAKIWAQIKDPLIALTSLPRAADVVAIVRSYDKKGLVDERLASALQWLKDFDHEWRKESRGENREDAA